MAEPQFLYINVPTAGGVGVVTLAYRMYPTPAGIAVEYAAAWCNPRDRFAKGGPKGGRARAGKRLASGDIRWTREIYVSPCAAREEIFVAMLKDVNEVVKGTTRMTAAGCDACHMPRWIRGHRLFMGNIRGKRKVKEVLR